MVRISTRMPGMGRAAFIFYGDMSLIHFSLIPLPNWVFISSFFPLFSPLLAHYWCKHLILICIIWGIYRYTLLIIPAMHSSALKPHHYLVPGSLCSATGICLESCHGHFVEYLCFFLIFFWQISAFICFSILGRLCQSLGSSEPCKGLMWGHPEHFALSARSSPPCSHLMPWWFFTFTFYISDAFSVPLACTLIIP